MYQKIAIFNHILKFQVVDLFHPGSAPILIPNEIISKSVGVIALGNRVGSHRVGIREFILLCLFGWIHKLCVATVLYLYFIPFIFARFCSFLSHDVQFDFIPNMDVTAWPQLGVPIGGVRFLHPKPRRFYSHNDGVIFQELLSRCDLLTGRFILVDQNSVQTMFIHSCSLKYTCSVTECIREASKSVSVIDTNVPTLTLFHHVSIIHRPAVPRPGFAPRARSV